ncbi:MAG: Tex family protein [Candidatus Latescibacterota bacterium]
MSTQYAETISTELNLQSQQVISTIALLDEGGTVPFIARYRKEATGLLDEVAIMQIRDRLEQLRELDKRRETILKSLEDQEVLSDELREKVSAAQSLSALEDIYLPYRPKRRTRATIAREKGLAPLADLLFKQDETTDPDTEAAVFIDKEKEVTCVEDALAGARDIIAEWINEDPQARAQVRDLYASHSTLRTRVTTGKEQEGSKYRDYFEWEEPLAKAPSHRVLAMRRGEKEQCLSLRIIGPEEQCLAALDQQFVKGDNACSTQVQLAAQDAFKRLLSLSMETEMRVESKNVADEEAIRVFAENLRQLLLAPPLGQKNVLALDPGFRTGCKLVCLDAQGNLTHTDVIYPDRHSDKAASTLQHLCLEHKIEAIAIGNGTGGRETERFARSIGLPKSIQIVMVNESGASVYSASDAARAEFADYDLTVRGSVSIGRRLMDPLAELVKIDPKSIGVGQYQHDVDQHALKRSLDDVVVSCVNSVGVEVNTASEQLLSYVSGLGPQLAHNIIEYRREHGPFTSRKGLKEVPRLGPKAFELAAGFLRIHDGENPLDASAVHPERYALVSKMAKDLDVEVGQLLRRDDLRRRIDLTRYASDEVGLPTLEDILSELSKPGRDPREEFSAFAFAEGIEKMEDLKPGMKLPGVITNITAFGAFVDIGVHQDGLIHISQLADRYVKDPNEIVKVQEQVEVRVTEVDLERKRIALSMRREQSDEEKVASAGPSDRPQKTRQNGPQQTTTRNKNRGKNNTQRRHSAPPSGSAFADALRQAGLNKK